LLTVFEPVTWALMAELAGESRATANGIWRPAINSLRQSEPQLEASFFAFGGFSSVGLLCLGAAIIAALVIGAELRGIGAIAAQAADA
jgi:hypothetical protein